ncbi:MAG: acyltransferase family protein [Microthrixaceae bacterium]
MELRLGLGHVTATLGHSGMQHRGATTRSFGLDVARAFAALGVLVTHVAFASGIVAPQRWSSPLREVLPRLDVGVTIFFVLSGLLVGRPFVRRTLKREEMPELRRYGIRRVSRIYPVYWAVLAVTLITVGRGSPGEVIADLLLVHIYVPSWAIGPITQSWSLATEIAFYAFLPAWFAVLRRRLDRDGITDPERRARWIAGGLVVWVLIAIGWRTGVVIGTDTYDFSMPGAVDTRGALLTWLPNHLDAFAIGVGIALALEAGWARRLNLSMRTASYVVAAAALWVASTGLDLPVTFTGFDGPQTHLRHLLFLVVAAGVILPSAFAGADEGTAAWHPPPWLARLALGAALSSYGVYLWHQWVTQEWFSERGLADFQAPFPAALGVVVVGSTALAALTYWFVERPATTLATGVGGGLLHEPPRRLGPQRSLDGLRGMAIVAVLGTHIVFLDAGSRTWALRGGFLGVDVFLGLSAFLIAAVLLRELDERASTQPAGDPSTPGFDVRSFARRRLRRLYPPLVVFLVVAGVISVLVLPTTAGQQLVQTVLALTFVSNWQLSWGTHPPFDMAHLWSLSLEAQFYLLMALGLWFGRRHLRRSDLIVAGLTIGAVAVWLWRLWLYHRGVELPALYERTGARADSMLLGVAAAFIWRSALVPENALRRVGVAAALFLAGAMVLSSDGSPWLFEGGFTLVAAASAAIVLAAATGTGVVAAIGRWAPLRWVGEISYSLYLWHLPIYIWTVQAFGDDAALPVKIAVAVPASFLAGWVSYRLVEVRVLAPWRRAT